MDQEKEERFKFASEAIDTSEGWQEPRMIIRLKTKNEGKVLQKAFGGTIFRADDGYLYFAITGKALVPFLEDFLPMLKDIPTHDDCKRVYEHCVKLYATKQ
jgi:hypothetical protein